VLEDFGFAVVVGALVVTGGFVVFVVVVVVAGSVVATVVGARDVAEVVVGAVLLEPPQELTSIRNANEVIGLTRNRFIGSDYPTVEY
jgi:hypothetical protein